MRFPSLLIRVSHLIFIQILFVFAALALVLFYPQDDNLIAPNYISRESSILSVADRLTNVLLSTPDSTEKIRTILNENEFTIHLDLIYYDSFGKIDKLVRLGEDENKKYTFSDYKSIGSLGALAIKKSTAGQAYLTITSEDNKFTHYFIDLGNDEGNLTMVIKAQNDQSLFQQNGRAYLLFLLFLISVLISLLIINLIYEGIKSPLSRLLKGFEKIASGDTFEIKVTGDKQIREVANGFNDMASKLTEKKKELEDSNEKLIRTNKTLEESESILTSLVDYSPEAILVTDLDNKIIIYNQEASKNFGYNQSSMTGDLITRFIPKSEIYNSKIQENEESSKPHEIICHQKNGLRFPALLVRTPLGLESHQPIAILYFIKNISESANYQDMILKLDRNASRGKMARSIAHEINNYLAILQGNLELVPMFLTSNKTEKLDSKLDVMKDTVTKITNFTEGLTRFSNETPEYSKEDLNQLIENLIAFLKPQNKFDNVRIDSNLADDIPLVEIDSGQIQLLLVNLFNNAAESQAGLNQDMWIEVTTAYDDSSKMASIKVADGGPGLDEQFIPDLFIKRFSTKQDGAGLGLITSKSVADNHNGHLNFGIEDSSKAVFEAMIPVSRPVDEEIESVDGGIHSVPVQ